MMIFAETGSCCDDCNWGMEHDCCHAKGIHYNVWGEGIETPEWCWRNFDSNGNRIPSLTF